MQFFNLASLQTASILILLIFNSLVIIVLSIYYIHNRWYSNNEKVSYKDPFEAVIIS